MKIICGIYKITSPSGKVYIGQSRHIYKRWSAHRRDTRTNSHIANSIKKYGHLKHVFEIIHECSSEELNDLERNYIRIYNSDNKKVGLNLKDGGNAGSKCSEELRRRFSEYQLKHSIFRGRAMPKKQRAKISASNMGKKFSDSFKRRCAENNSGSKSPTAKMVINLQTGIYYDHMKEAAASIGMRPMYFYRQLRGERPNKTQFIYA